MSILNGQNIAPQESGNISEITIDSLCEQQSYISSLEQFLLQPDNLHSLSYWLSEYTDITHIKSKDDIRHIILQSISDIDHLINDLINEIIHNEKFQTLESSWRGLWYLVVQSYGANNIKIKALDVNWQETVRDLSRSIEFDQSLLFKKIYSDEYGTPGGEPYGVLIADYEISHKITKRHPADDISTLENISQIAAAAFSPFICSSSYELFGLDDFSALGQPLEFEKIFSQNEYIKWNSFRQKPDSKFIGLTIPRILMRKPYRTSPGSYKGLFFYDKTNDSGKNGYLWGNACYAFASVLIREFANVGWFGHIRGVPRNMIGGGLVTNLSSAYFETDADNIALKPVTDVLITDAQERILSDLGFIPLCQSYDSPFAAFFSNQSVHKSMKMETKDATINAKLSSMLQHILCASRIAHYIKVIIRDKVGSFITAVECEDYLRNWLFKYTTGREDMEWEEQARYPLREAAVKVKEHPEKSGTYLCVIHLRPHYQLDHMVSELELVTELAQTS